MAAQPRRRPGVQRLATTMSRGAHVSQAVLVAAIILILGAVGGAVAIASASSEQEAQPPGIIRAESFASESGARLEGTADTGGGRNVGWLANGDWMRYAGINLHRAGQLTTTIRVAAATNAGGTIELHADSASGPLLATFAITATGGWQKWVSLPHRGAVTVNGAHDVFILLRSEHHSDFVNINWFAFGTGATPGTTGQPATGAPATTGPAPTSTGPAPTATAGPVPPPALGWVPVNAAEHAAMVAKFWATTPKPITNNPVRVAEFHAACTVSHHANDDPIVFPGLAGASHNHTFWGNKNTNAATTAQSLRNGATSCAPAEDHSAYWIPTLYQNGKVVDPTEVTVYYGSRLKDPSQTQPFPFGLRMIVGDAKKQSDPQGNHFWCAGIGGEIGRNSDGSFPVCAPTAHLVRQITFPDCWDGKHLDSPNHKDHMQWGTHEGKCPTSHPVPIPSVSYVIPYALSANTEGITLASGTAVSMHADFFNAWEPDALAARVRTCLNQKAKCNAAGTF